MFDTCNVTMYHIANGGVTDAIVGSSNFTLSELGLAEANNNIELNLIIEEFAPPRASRRFA